jgi:N-acetylglutamate synthase-like GNAT family acetyltransferase
MSEAPAGAANITVATFNSTLQQQVIDTILYIQNVEFKVGISLEDQPDLLDIETHYVVPGGQFWVALTPDGRVVGTIGLQAKPGGIGILKKLFVLADYRGKQTQCAAKLFDALLGFARSSGMRTLVLDTPSVATRSHAFYKANGFREIPQTEVPVKYDYPDRNSLFFRLDLV